MWGDLQVFTHLLACILYTHKNKTYPVQLIKIKINVEVQQSRKTLLSKKAGHFLIVHLICILCPEFENSIQDDQTED